MLTDEKGEYRLNAYGSKERPAGPNVWVMDETDMSQAEIDARATQAAKTAVQEAKQAKLTTLLREHLKLTYRIMVFADPASTAAQKSAAMAYIQEKRAWIEANVGDLQDLLGG